MPGPRFEDGRRWTAGTLRLLVRAVDAARTLSDKVELVRRHVRSLADLSDVLEACFYQDDSLAVFSLLSDAELARMLQIGHQHRDAMGLDEAGCPSWGAALQRHVDALPTARRQAVGELLDALNRRQA